MTPALLDDTVDRRQAHSSAVSLLLGGEERFEHLLLSLCIQALTAVRNTQQHVGAWQDLLRIGAHLVLTQLDLGSLQVELAAAGHGVAGIDHQIDDNSLDLQSVRGDSSDTLISGEGQIDIRGQESAQHRFGLADNIVEVEKLGCKHLLPAERQDLLGKTGRLGAGLLDDLNILEQLPLTLPIRLYEMAGIEDGHEHVVEIVCNASGELSDDLHLMRLEQPLLQ